MTRDEVITLVLNRLGNRAGDAALTAAAILEIKQIQVRLEEKPTLPWFCLSEAAAGLTTANDPRVPLPSDFILEPDEGALWIKNDEGKWKELLKDDYDALRNAYRLEAAGIPVKYALIGRYFRLFPTPSTQRDLEMIYYKNQTVLDTDVENNWTKYASDLMIAELGITMAEQYVKDFNTGKSFRLERLEAVRRLEDKEIARQEANLRRMMGD